MFPCRHAPEITSKVSPAPFPSAILAIPEASIIGATLRARIFELQGTLRNDQLLTIVDHPIGLTISDRLARARGQLLNSIDDLFASQPDEAALARAMLLGDRSFVEHDRVVEYPDKPASITCWFLPDFTSAR